MKYARSGRHTFTVKLLWAAFLGGLFVAWSLKALSPLARVWDLDQTTQPGQLTVYNTSLKGGYYGMPVEMADLNGDGFMDLVLAPMAANGGNGSRLESGEVYVYPGNGQIEGTIDRGAFAGSPPGLTVWGAREGDFLGTELYTADVNGDGVQDLLISAQNYDGIDGTRDSAGGAFIVLGRSDLLDGSQVIDTLAPPKGVIRIVGAHPGDRLGIWVEAGDLDGDGFSDILLGADQYPADSPASDNYHRGMVVVIYGRSQFPDVIDLSKPIDGVSFILGRDGEDHFGSCIHSRDLNRDGRAELIASAGLSRLSATYRSPNSAFEMDGIGGGDGPDNSRPEAGEVMIFFGLPPGQRLPNVVDLAQPLPPELDGMVTTIYGREPYDLMGEEITTGDFNGDQYPDLALGALSATNPHGAEFAGSVHVLYWGPGLEGKTIDLNPEEGHLPEGLQVSFMYGLNMLDILGDTLSAGDINHDGFDDLAIGIPHVGHGDQPEVGLVAVAFGQPEPWPPEWVPDGDELPLGLQVSYILGRAAFDLMSYSMEAKDYDADGYVDVFPNAMRGDGEKDAHEDAGEAYVVSGYRLANMKLSVCKVEPSEGFLRSETEVLISGSGFTTDRDTALFAGGKKLTDVHVITASKIRAVVPRGDAPGAVPLRVETRYETFELADAFVYTGNDVFIRGDTDMSRVILINDPILVLRWLFQGQAAPPCLDASDSNDDGNVNVSDVVYTLNFLFLGGRPPPPPFPQAGPDPTRDNLGC